MRLLRECHTQVLYCVFLVLLMYYKHQFKWKKWPQESIVPGTQTLILSLVCTCTFCFSLLVILYRYYVTAIILYKQAFLLHNQDRTFEEKERSKGKMRAMKRRRKILFKKLFMLFQFSHIVQTCRQCIPTTGVYYYGTTTTTSTSTRSTRYHGEEVCC